MKKLNLLSLAIIFLAVIFSTNLLALEQSAVKKAVTRPDVIKINPAAVDMCSAMLSANVEQSKRSVELIKSQATDYGLYIDQNVESDITKLKNKINECKNKAYTAQEQKAANCTNDMTVEVCGKKLFNACIQQEKQRVRDTFMFMQNYSDRIQKELETITKNKNSIQNCVNKLEQ